MIKATLIGLTSILLVASSADAQTAGAFMANPAFRGPRPVRCTSTVEIQRCAADDLRIADRKMSTRYMALRSRLSPTERQTLLSEQRRWLASRDRDCLALRRGSGSMSSLNVARCWVRTTTARTVALEARSRQESGSLSMRTASAFVGRWRGGEGTYMKIARRGDGVLVVDNQWGLDADDKGTFTATIDAAGLRFRRNGVLETVRPGAGSNVNRSALSGKRECLIVSRDEGYCRY